MSEEKKESNGGAGLDIGTANLLCARTVGNKTQIQMQRNAFIEVDNDEWQQKALTSLKVQYAKYEGRMFVMGDSAFELANVLKKSTRRPMRNGMISPDDIDALPIIKLMIKKLLGNPRSPNEEVVYSVPANPIDSPMNVAYHKKIFEGVLLSLGYKPKAIIEGHAVIMSELMDDDFTGAGISCVLPGNPVITPTGIKKIEEIKKGEYVFNRKGDSCRVVKTTVTERAETVYRIKTEGYPTGISLTGDHQVWVCREGSWMWLRADQIRIGDKTMEPVPRDSNNSREPRIKTTMEIENGIKVSTVRGIEKFFYSGPVYDLTVDKDSSFVMPYMTVHNCGGGMINVCVSYRSIPAVTFSTARGGDWIDHEAAMVTGNEQTRMTRIKERGVNLIEPKTREEQALAIYTRELIEGTLKTIANKLVSEKQVPEFESPISIVLAGGTALAGGFRDVFEDVFKSVRLPIEVKEIRLAAEPLQSVAKGCLIHALNR